MAEIIVTVTPAGSVSIDAKGFSGSGCAKATEQLEIVLGGQGAKSKKKKPEFFAPAKSGAKNTIKGW